MFFVIGVGSWRENLEGSQQLGVRELWGNGWDWLEQVFFLFCGLWFIFQELFFFVGFVRLDCGWILSFFGGGIQVFWELGFSILCFFSFGIGVLGSLVQGRRRIFFVVLVDFGIFKVKLFLVFFCIKKLVRGGCKICLLVDGVKGL